MRINLSKTVLYSIASLLVAGCMIACNKKNDYNVPIQVLKEWHIDVTSTNTNYQTGSTESIGTLNMKLYSDNSMTYDLKFNFVEGGISGATINFGDPLTEGPVLLNINPRITGTYINGVVTGMRQGLVDTLANSSFNTYFNVYNAAYPQGIARGQLNTEIIYTSKVLLSGSNVSPVPVSTTTTGLAMVRVTKNNKLYYKINIMNPDPADPVVSATLHQGVAGSTGSLLATLITSPSEFNMPKEMSINTSMLSTIENSSLFINVSSVNYPYPSAKLRGQVK